MNVSEIVSGLDDYQKAVVTYDGGDCLVLAGAGSGKTRCMQHRVAYLLETEEGLNPKSVIALSFTRKAANELRERICKMHELGGQTTTATFHSLCFQILKKNKIRSKLYDGAQGFIKKHFATVKWNVEEPAGYVLGMFNRAKMLALPESEFEDFWREADPLNAGKIAQLYKLYEEEKRENDAVDFADMLYKCMQYMERDPDILSLMRRWMRHVIVDEVQDLNAIQFKLVTMWTEGRNNLMMVGDVRQSMYGFRGADVRELLDFADQRGMERLYLKKNYRSVTKVVDRSNEMIRYGELERELPDSIPFREEEGLIESYAMLDEAHEADYVARRVRAMMDDGFDLNEIACLYRVNAQAQPLERAFNEYKIPYHVIGGTSFFERKEIKDAIAYLRVVASQTDEESLKRIANVPTRYLGRAFYREFDDAHTEGANVFDGLNGVIASGWRNARNVRVLKEDLMRLVNLDKPEAVLRGVFMLRSQLDRDRTFYDLYKSDDGADTARTENLDALMDMVRSYSSLEEFIVEVDSQAGETEDDYEEQHRVQFLTVHRAKGLEFGRVFVIGFSDRTFPHSKGDPDEERRVAYVAITRAKDHLVITSPTVRYGKAADPSPFLMEMGISPAYPEALDHGTDGQKASAGDGEAGDIPA